MSVQLRPFPSKPLLQVHLKVDLDWLVQFASSWQSLRRVPHISKGNADNCQLH